MWWKALGVFLVLLVVGAASGYALGDHSTDQPGTIPSAKPVPAVSPSVPTPAAYTQLPDAPQPALVTGVPLEATHLRIGGATGFAVQAEVPTGWPPNHSANRWTYAVPGYPWNTYGLRIDIIAGSHQSVSIVKQARIDALRESQQQGGSVKDFELQSNTDDTFVATYLTEGYLRLTRERFLTLGGTTAYVDVAVTGRAEDDAGLADLIDRVSESMFAG